MDSNLLKPSKIFSDKNWNLMTLKNPKLEIDDESTLHLE